MPKGLPYFYVDEPGERVRPSEDDAAHAVRSLRLRPGDEITVADGRGWVGRGTLTPDGDVQIVESRTLGPPTPRVRVAMAPPASDRAWWAVQKLTELGVDEIALVESTRSTRALGRDGHALRRAVAVAREASKQSRRTFLPEVTVSGARGLFVGAPDQETSVVLFEDATEPLSSVLPERLERISAYIGPEGGLAPEDLDAARERGAVLASLGEPNLRTETAAIAAAAIVLSRYGRLG